MFDLTTNADEVADDLVGVVEEATASADEEAADYALAIVGPRTPRRSGRLAAGLRSVVVSNGFDVTNAVDYANVVNARTGFLSGTIADAAEDFAAIYDRHLQARLDDVEP